MTDTEKANDTAYARSKPFDMECVIHYGKDSEKYIGDFVRKKAALLRDDLSELNEEELESLSEMLENIKKNA